MRFLPDRIRLDGSISMSQEQQRRREFVDLGYSIIGATDHCDYPAEAKKIPRVGGLVTPNVEKLLSMSPDLVIATDFKDNELDTALRTC